MRALALAILIGCVASVAELGPPPDLRVPETWRGLDDQRQPIVIMTPAAFDNLKAQIAEARTWMRHAEAQIGSEP